MIMVVVVAPLIWVIQLSEEFEEDGEEAEFEQVI